MIFLRQKSLGPPKGDPPRKITARTIACVILIGLAVLLTAGAEAASPKTVRISGQTSIRDDCRADGAQIRSEVGPSVAVNPTDPDNAVALWQQDRYQDSSGSRGIGVATTFDGGKTWQPGKPDGALPEHSVCTGGTDERASDPRVSIGPGPDGTIYAASFFHQRDQQDTNPAGDPAGFNPVGDPAGFAVSTSPDGGLTWSKPLPVHRGLTVSSEAITADPYRAGTAYMVWRQGNFYSCLVARFCHVTAATMFSRTDDHGFTWTPARPILVLPPPEFAFLNEILVLRDGTLLNVYRRFGNFSKTPVESLRNCFPHGLGDGEPCGRTTIEVQRSDDGGLTWSEGAEIDGGQMAPLLDKEDPDTSVRSGEGWAPSADVAPDGTAYVTWADRASAYPGAAEAREARTEIVVASSSDSGRTWTDPIPAATVPAEAFLPSLAVDGRGTVGVTWYDWRKDRPGDSKLTTDVWFAGSRDGGHTWEERHVAGSFDLRTAPRTELFGEPKLFLGDYQGLAGMDKGFMAVYAMARPAATDGDSDIFATRIHS